MGRGGGREWEEEYSWGRIRRFVMRVAIVVEILQRPQCSRSLR